MGGLSENCGRIVVGVRGNCGMAEGDMWENCRWWGGWGEVLRENCGEGRWGTVGGLGGTMGELCGCGAGGEPWENCGRSEGELWENCGRNVGGLRENCERSVGDIGIHGSPC